MTTSPPEQVTTARHPLPGPYRPWGERRREAWAAAWDLLVDTPDGVTGAHLVRVMRPADIAIETARRILQEAYRHGVIERVPGDLFTPTEYGRWQHSKAQPEGDSTS